MKQSELVVGETYAFGRESYPDFGVYVGSDFPTVYSGRFGTYKHRSSTPQAIFAVKVWNSEELQPRAVTFNQVFMTKVAFDLDRRIKADREAKAKADRQGKELTVSSFNATLKINANLDYDYRYGAYERGVLLSYSDFIRLAQAAMGVKS